MEKKCIIYIKHMKNKINKEEYKQVSKLSLIWVKKVYIWLNIVKGSIDEHKYIYAIMMSFYMLVTSFSRCFTFWNTSTTNN